MTGCFSWWRSVGALVLSSLLLSSCSHDASQSPTREQAVVDYDILLNLPADPVAFSEQVQPVLERRCVVCHGCYDAPCQLKLSSHEGLMRGASTERVYDGSRILPAQPTRLYIDAHSPAQWREKGFHPVIAEAADGVAEDPQQRLQGSLLYRMLRLKQRHPQARLGMLADELDVGLDREQVCTSLDEFDRFEREHPGWGMPYAMPNLSDGEYQTLVRWLAQGAQAPPPAEPSAAAAEQIPRWEAFFNQASSKQRLVSRYLYEHLFLGHLHFAGAPEREFYRLVRSTSPPGQPIQEIATLRPYDAPGDVPGAVFYYRLRRHPGAVVAKDHVVYELSDARMRRYRELFVEPDYVVTELPSHEPLTASNPFKVFAPIPVESRYRFLLDDARFFIEGFIKGPVCRGQIALNVIEDQFWVLFFDPDSDLAVEDPAFLERMADYLQLPSGDGDTLKLLKVWTDYAQRQRRYMTAKTDYFKQVHAKDLNDAMGYIWDGDGRNPNAALTIFRHLDSASVTEGLVGDYPDTAWVIDYPQLERIHYLLVAGFNVFGNAGHQLNTRLYMDFLRMEGEDHFLAFLPAADRKRVRDSWYRGIRQDLGEFDDDHAWLAVEAVTGYQTDDPQRELYHHLMARLGPLAGPPEVIDRCDQAGCETYTGSAQQQRADRALHRVARMQGPELRAFPDVTFLRVRTGEADGAAGAGAGADDGAGDLAYSVIRNKAYHHVSSMFADDSRREERDIENDTLTVLPWLEGSYPNFFFAVDLADIEQFAQRFSELRTRDDYERFVALYGVRRTNTQFWAVADWFQDRAALERPVLSGLYDLNRYQNR